MSVNLPNKGPGYVPSENFIVKTDWTGGRRILKLTDALNLSREYKGIKLPFQRSKGVRECEDRLNWIGAD